MRKVLVWARRPLSWTALREKGACEDRLVATVMWMFKGDLLRVSAESGTGFSQGLMTRYPYFSK